MRHAYLTFKKLLLLTLAFACAPKNHHGESGNSGLQQATDVSSLPATHGMVLFGQDKLFISHIPMFQQPHDWQAIFEVEISPPEAMRRYLEEQPLGKQTLITLQPEKFVLRDLLNGKIKTFQADMFRGQFEGDGKRIFEHLSVSIKQNSWTKPLKRDTPPFNHPHYLTMQQGGLGYLAHEIASPPSFEHILSYQWRNGARSQEWQESGGWKKLFFQDLGSDEQRFRLKSGSEYFVVKGGNDWIAVPKEKVNDPGLAAGSITIFSDFYCTEGDGFFQPCR